MKKSENSFQGEPSKLSKYTEAPLTPQQKKEILIANLGHIRANIQDLIIQIDDYIMTQEKILDGRYTPTQEVDELKERLKNAKRTAEIIKKDFQNIDKYYKLISENNSAPDYVGDETED